MIKFRAISSSASAATRGSTRKAYQLRATILEFLSAASQHALCRGQ
jgi:hypothetical protein